MSTTFVINNDGYEVPIAFRSGGGITWQNQLANLLPDELKVFPIDNSPQGIFTIGDIKKVIKGETSISPELENFLKELNKMEESPYLTDEMKNMASDLYELIENRIRGEE